MNESLASPNLKKINHETHERHENMKNIRTEISCISCFSWLNLLLRLFADRRTSSPQRSLGKSAYYYNSKFARLAQIFQESKTLGFGYFPRKGAKTLSSEEKNNNPQTNSLPPIRPLRLGVFARYPPNSCLMFFARDNPRLTGARSAPYENLRVLRAFVVKYPVLLCVLCG